MFSLKQVIAIAVIVAAMWFYFGWMINELHQRYLKSLKNEWTPLNKQGRWND